MTDEQAAYDYWQGIANQPSPYTIPRVSSGGRTKRHKLPIVLTEYPTGETTITVNGKEYYGVKETELLEVVQGYLEQAQIDKVDTKGNKPELAKLILKPTHPNSKATIALEAILRCPQGPTSPLID